MDATREGRHLAAIMFVDMVGYSARMQENEQRAIAAVRGLWDLVRPILAATDASGRLAHCTKRPIMALQKFPPVS